MATCLVAIFFLHLSQLKKNNCMGTIIHIKPKEHAKVVGNASFSGTLTDGDGKTHSFKGKKIFTIPGDGIILDLSRENDRVTDAILRSKVLQPWFSKSAKFRYRFDRVNLEADAEAYLATDELKTDYKSQVLKMKDTELITYGYLFKLGRDPKMIKSGLYKLIDNDATRAKVGKIFLHPDKLLMMYAYFGLKNGDAANKTGLWKTSKDLYYFGETVLGLGDGNMLAFLKSDTEASNSIYEILKTDYEKALKEDNKK